MGVRIAANAKSTGEMALPQAARTGNKLTRVLSVQSALNGMSTPGDVLLLHRQGFTLGHPDTEFHEIMSGDEFGDRVLNLNTRVNLEEIEIAVGVPQELKGGQALVAHGFSALADQSTDF